MNATKKPNRRRLHWRIQAAIIAFLMIPTVMANSGWVIGRAGIYNMGGANIGVVKYWTSPNTYQQVLPVGRSTSGMYGWLYAVGFYTGPGWCTNYYTSNGSDYVYRWTVRGPTFASKVWADDGAVYSYPCP